MSDRRPSYDRRQTRPFPRETLPPISTTQLSSRTADTLIECPMCEHCVTCQGRHHVTCEKCGLEDVHCETCSACFLCQGTHIVTPEVAESYRQGGTP